MSAMDWCRRLLRACRFRNSQLAVAHHLSVGSVATPSEKVLQQFCRFRTPAGAEAIRGTLLAEFSAGQREATLYVAFCPPFQRLPEITVHAADDPSIVVQVVQRLHNGAQFEVRLSEPADEPFAVSVAIFASEPCTTTQSTDAT